ncbi:hypothetical protein PUN4_10036 [Paraburkholderia unamae]|nr:hypothetical protein PUN4_10036 [Paraburkholderia unamae]
MRSSSSRLQSAIDSGSERSRLPASISFCKFGRSPISTGSASMSLSVRISQRNCGGSACPGTCRMRFALKPTMLSDSQSPSTAGNSVNGLFEANRMRRWRSLGRSCGSEVSALPERSSTSRVSARSKISRGNSVNPQASLSCRAPASCPSRSWSRVAVFTRELNWKMARQSRARSCNRGNADSAMAILTGTTVESGYRGQKGARTVCVSGISIGPCANTRPLTPRNTHVRIWPDPGLYLH